MPLAVGTKAPDFTLSTKTADGPKQIRLSDNFGKKNTLLLFFPMAFTGTCTTEMCEVSAGLNGYTEFERRRLRNQRRQSVCAGSVGAEGKDHGAVAERLRTQNREGIWRDVRLVPAANESRDERRAQALCVHHRQERGDPIRREQ